MWGEDLGRKKQCVCVGRWTGYSSVSVVGTLEGMLVVIMSLEDIFLT